MGGKAPKAPTIVKYKPKADTIIKTVQSQKGYDDIANYTQTLKDERLAKKAEQKSYLDEHKAGMYAKEAANYAAAMPLSREAARSTTGENLTDYQQLLNQTGQPNDTGQQTGGLGLIGAVIGGLRDAGKLPKFTGEKPGQTAPKKEEGPPEVAGTDYMNFLQSGKATVGSENYKDPKENLGNYVKSEFKKDADYGNLDKLGDSNFGEDFKEETRTKEMTDREWLADASERILGRQLNQEDNDQSGEHSAGGIWRSQLASGSSRDDIMDQMIKSDEYQARDAAVKQYRVDNKGENPDESWLDAKVGAKGWLDKSDSEKATSAKQGKASADVSFAAGQQAAKQGITLPKGAKDNVHFSVGHDTASKEKVMGPVNEKETDHYLIKDKNEPYKITISNDKSPYKVT